MPALSLPNVNTYLPSDEAHLRCLSCGRYYVDAALIARWQGEGREVIAVVGRGDRARLIVVAEARQHPTQGTQVREADGAWAGLVGAWPTDDLAAQTNAWLDGAY